MSEGGGGRKVCAYCVCVCVRVCMCMHVRACEREREFCPLSGFQYTGTLRPVPVYCTEATRIGALGITASPMHNTQTVGM